jgi:hypothetical protein
VAGHVPGAAEQEGRSEHGGGQTAGRARAGRQLGGDRGNPGEHESDGSDRDPGDERAGRRLANADQRQAQRDRQHHVGRDRRDQRGGQRRVTARDGCADQLGPAGLLALPGMPDHSEDAHQRGEHREQHVVAHHRVRADTRARRQAQHPYAGALDRDPHVPDQVGVAGELVIPHRRGRGQEPGQRHDPGGQAEPVAVQREPSEPDRAGERVHRTPARSSS